MIEIVTIYSHITQEMIYNYHRYKHYFKFHYIHAGIFKLTSRMQGNRGDELYQLEMRNEGLHRIKENNYMFVIDSDEILQLSKQMIKVLEKLLTEESRTVVYIPRQDYFGRIYHPRIYRKTKNTLGFFFRHTYFVINGINVYDENNARKIGCLKIPTIRLIHFSNREKMRKR